MLLETTVPLKLTHFLSAVFQVCTASQAHVFIKACSSLTCETGESNIGSRCQNGSCKDSSPVHGTAPENLKEDIEILRYFNAFYSFFSADR